MAEVAEFRPCPKGHGLVAVTGKRTDGELVGHCTFPGCDQILHVYNHHSATHADPAEYEKAKSGPPAAATKPDGVPVATKTAEKVDADELHALKTAASNG